MILIINRTQSTHKFYTYEQGWRHEADGGGGGG